MQDKDNTCTLPENIKLIFTRCKTDKNTRPSLATCYLFLKLVQINLIFSGSVHVLYISTLLPIEPCQLLI